MIKKMMANKKPKPVKEPKLPGTPVEAMAPAQQEKSEEQLNMEAKRHFDTLMEADEIKNDPKKMEHVHKIAGRHMKAIHSIQDLKDLHEAKYGGQKPKKEGYMAG